jgi:hypothetical protein
MTTRTADEITQDYSAMLNSVSVINADKHDKMSDEDWNDKVSRNVEHLELMTTKDYWTNEDMSTVNQAIDDGNTYLGGN